MIVRYMPFWFIDVIKTEEKLSKYSEEEIKLKKFSPFEIIFGVFALVIVLEYGYFSVKSIGYYFRLKNKTNNI